MEEKRKDERKGGRREGKREEERDGMGWSSCVKDRDGEQRKGDLDRGSYYGVNGKLAQRKLPEIHKDDPAKTVSNSGEGS